mmetsp:Transcript_152645/g.489542  ORF Transcript_152645/g.489542 Transcript_152645/m.489542 type:complete len:428 (+) Transcript_152645:286-1569(+)
MGTTARSTHGCSGSSHLSSPPTRTRSYSWTLLAVVLPHGPPPRMPTRKATRYSSVSSTSRLTSGSDSSTQRSSSAHSANLQHSSSSLCSGTSEAIPLLLASSPSPPRGHDREMGCTGGQGSCCTSDDGTGVAETARKHRGRCRHPSFQGDQGNSHGCSFGELRIRQAFGLGDHQGFDQGHHQPRGHPGLVWNQLHHLPSQLGEQGFDGHEGDGYPLVRKGQGHAEPRLRPPHLPCLCHDDSVALALGPCGPGHRGHGDRAGGDHLPPEPCRHEKAWGGALRGRATVSHPVRHDRLCRHLAQAGMRDDRWVQGPESHSQARSSTTRSSKRDPGIVGQVRPDRAMSCDRMAPLSRLLSVQAASSTQFFHNFLYRQPRFRQPRLFRCPGVGGVECRASWWSWSWSSGRPCRPGGEGSCWLSSARGWRSWQ